MRGYFLLPHNRYFTPDLDARFMDEVAAWRVARTWDPARLHAYRRQGLPTRFPPALTDEKADELLAEWEREQAAAEPPP